MQMQHVVTSLIRESKTSLSTETYLSDSCRAPEWASRPRTITPLGNMFSTRKFGEHKYDITIYDELCNMEVAALLNSIFFLGLPTVK